MNEELKLTDEQYEELNKIASNMEKDLREVISYDEWAGREYGETEVDFNYTAFQMAKLGYRKIHKDSVVLSREEYEILIDVKELKLKVQEIANNNSIRDIIEIDKEARKETAEKFAKRLKDYINDKCCEELGDVACDTDYYTIDISKTFDDIDEICKEITDGEE